MPDLHGEEAGEPVEVTLAVLVEDIGAFAPHDHWYFVVGITAETREVHPEIAVG